MDENTKSLFLFPEPSFIGGMGSVLDIGGNFFPLNASRSGEEADAKAIKSDWQNVGKDIRSAMDSECNGEQK